ncbi:MAG: hypothetical protein QG643_1410, partial [Pseudomonadota bacterium]|nr:hypothetical protein [Pseudomonadota bacterium]
MNFAPTQTAVSLAVLAALSACGGDGDSSTAAIETASRVNATMGTVRFSMFPQATTTEPYARFVFAAEGASTYE